MNFFESENTIQDIPDGIPYYIPLFEAIFIKHEEEEYQAGKAFEKLFMYIPKNAVAFEQLRFKAKRKSMVFVNRRGKPHFIGDLSFIEIALLRDESCLERFDEEMLYCFELDYVRELFEQPQREIERLELELNKAVLDERYEQAACLKREIEQKKEETKNKK